MQCPRCPTTLETYTRHGAANAAPIAADMCLSCGGLWLDAGEVKLAYPALAALEDRRGDVLSVGEMGAGIARCPRCEMAAIEVPFFDVRLDMCTACHGVWIDGDELEALSHSMDRGDGLPVPDQIVGGYRTAAAGVMTKLLATCGVCAKQVALRATRSTARGVVCEACAKELPAGEGEEAGATADEEYVVPTESALWGFVRDVGVALGAIVLAMPKCASCGCRQSSHCRC